MKALCLLSGGLDSTLAAKTILDCGIELEAVNFVTTFCTCTSKSAGCLASKTAADTLGIKLQVFNVSKEYLPVVKDPKHGYGSNMNPCIDCRIFMLKKAREYMKEIGASFIVTGEVLGERPMSQRYSAMQLIEKEAGLEGLILRPLSAGLLKPTVPETEGWVDRKKLLAIRGRSRKPQMELAKRYGIKDYPCPAGGCLLTDPGFAARMRDLMAHNGGLCLDEVRLLKVGRHFRLAGGLKLVVGRDDTENKQIENLFKPEDMRLEAADFTGATGLLRGRADRDALIKACSVVAYYGKGRVEKRVRVRCGTPGGENSEVFEVCPAPEDLLSSSRI